MVMAVLLSIGLKNSGYQSEKKNDKWFEKREWLQGWKAIPDSSIDKKELEVSYKKFRDRWVKAFGFLKNNELRSMELKRYDIDGDNVYATVSEYITKSPGDTHYEAHRKYIDIQYVVSGKERIGIAPLSTKQAVIQPYDPVKDIEFMSVSGGREHLAIPGRFFILFPGDAHMPGLMDGSKDTVRKVVVKIKAY